MDTKAQFRSNILHKSLQVCVGPRVTPNKVKLHILERPFIIYYLDVIF